MFNKLIKSIIILTIFLVPLFYLPITGEQFQFNKEMLFLILVLIAGLLWFGRAVRKKKLEIIRSPLDVPILLVVLAYGLSTIVSSDWLNSLINWKGIGLASFITILSLTLFYFICVNIFVKNSKNRLEPSVNLLLGTVLGSSFVAQIILYLSIFNVLFLPNQHKSFNTLRSSSNLMFFVALTLPIALYFVLRQSTNRIKSQLLTVVSLFYLGLSLLTLNTINFTSGWIVAVVGSFIFLILFTAYHMQMLARINLAWLSAGVLAISLISVIVKPGSLLNIIAPENFKPKIPAEISLSKSISREIAFNSSWQGPISFITGQGPDNFVEVFSRYRPVEFNQNPLWKIRFNRAANFFYEVIATIGWLGLTVFLVLFIFFIATVGFVLYGMRETLSANNLMEVSNQRQEKPTVHKKGSGLNIATHPNHYIFPLITLLSVFIAILTSLWLSVPGMSILALLWLTFALSSIIGILNSPQNFAKIEFSFKKSAKNALFLSFGLVFVFVLLLFFTIFMGRLYWAEFYYHQGLNILNKENTTESLQKAQVLINQAINLNQRRADYYLSYAKISLAQVQREITANGLENTETNKIQVWLAQAVNQSKKAELLKPHSVSMWETRGLIFEAVSQWTSQARIHAINSFNRAVDLEPTNPILYYKLGENQRLMALAQKNINSQSNERQEGNNKSTSDDSILLEQAKTNLEKAIELKPDYLAPRLSLAKIAESEGDLTNAIGHLKAGLQFQINQNDAEAYYTLSRLMYNSAMQNQEKTNLKLKEIIPVLDRAIELLPNYSNALYTRSLIYRKLNNLKQAQVDMKQVVKLNPDNKEAKAQLDEIKKLISPSPLVLPKQEQR